MTCTRSAGGSITILFFTQVNGVYSVQTKIQYLTFAPVSLAPLDNVTFGADHSSPRYPLTFLAAGADTGGCSALALASFAAEAFLSLPLSSSLFRRMALPPSLLLLLRLELRLLLLFLVGRP